MAEKLHEVPLKCPARELIHLLQRLEQLAASPAVLDQHGHRRDGLLLTNQAGLKQLNPPWRLIESVIRGLNTTDNRYCCLSQPEEAYIQTLRHPAGMLLERRLIQVTGDGAQPQLRACLPSRPANAVRKPTDAKPQLVGRAGFLMADDVVGAFREFCVSPESSGWLDWKPVSI